MINLDNLVLVGPGSEWFWTAVSGLVLAITFVAIYRQLALARNAAAFAIVSEINAAWYAERMQRQQLLILQAIAADVPLADIPAGPATAISGFWEHWAALVRAGHADARLVHDEFGPVIRFWNAVLAPSTARYRREHRIRVLEHFDWLAARMAALDREQHRVVPVDEPYIRSAAADRITWLLSDLRIEEELRTPVANPAIQAGMPKPRAARRPAAAASSAAAEAEDDATR